LPSVEDIAGKIRSTLRLTDPDLDTTIGTPVRKIIDAVSEAIAEASTDAYLVSYQYDIDTKSGAELDDFTRLFGFSRLSARRATGLITFERTTPATQPIVIPANTQVVTDSLPQVVIATVTPAVFAIGTEQVTVPAQAVTAGSAGNIPAHSVGRAIALIQGVSSFSNTQSFTGGADAETDDAYRSRFKRTVFRSLAGTECQPPGTQVLVPKGFSPGTNKIECGYQPIETLSIGDLVVAAKRGAILPRGGTITGITSRNFSGQLITVKSQDGRTSRYTPNHRCIARIIPALDGKAILYMMKRGDSYRVGKTTMRLGHRQDAAGLTMRMKMQDADAIWVLDVFDTNEEAYLAEHLCSWQFGVPSVQFMKSSQERDGKQEFLDAFWQKMGSLESKASECLASYGRMIEYPFRERGSDRQIWSRITEVRACNLIDGMEFMDADRMMDERPCPVRYASISVSREFYEGPVWSLDVDRNEYIADGFVTHNSMYLATALEHPSVTQANVVGAVKRHREQIQITSGTGTSSIFAAKHIYPDTSALGTTIASGDILTPGVHYTFSANLNPPTVTSLSTSACPDGIYDLEFDYLSSASRNDPESFISNRVDIWIRGQRPTEAVETMVFSSGRTFNATPGSTLNKDNWVRESGVTPSVDNFYLPFGFAPIIEPGPTMSINGVTYIKNQHYWLVENTTPNGMSNRGGLSGVELLSVTNGLALAEPPNAHHWSQDYTFDAAPRDVDVAVQRWRLITNDLWVHAARRIKLRAYFAVILNPGYVAAAVESAVYTALQTFTQEVSFRSVLQASDALAVVHAVPGVDAVRFTTSTDNAVNYAWQRVAPSGAVLETYATSGRAIDIECTDDTVIDLDAVSLIVKAPNTWSTV